MKQGSLAGALAGLLSFFLLLVSIGMGFVQNGVNEREAERLRRLNAYTVRTLQLSVARLTTQHRLDVEYVRNADRQHAIDTEYQLRLEERLRTIHGDCDAREMQTYRDCSLWGGHVRRHR